MTRSWSIAAIVTLLCFVTPLTVTAGEVAIVGAVRGTPGVYQCPEAATVSSALNVAGSINPLFSGRVRLIRGRSLVELTDLSLRTQHGDVIIALSNQSAPKTTRTVVLKSRWGRPVVAELDASVTDLSSLAQRLGLTSSEGLLILGPPTNGTLHDGVVVMAETVPAATWQALTTALPPVTTSTSVAVSRVATVSVTDIQTPTAAGDKHSFRQGINQAPPDGRAPESGETEIAESSDAVTNAIYHWPMTIEPQSIRVEHASEFHVEPDTLTPSAAIELLRAETAPRSPAETALDLTPPPTESANTTSESNAADTTQQASQSSDGTVMFVGLSLAIVLLVGGGYIMLHSPTPATHLPTSPSPITRNDSEQPLESQDADEQVTPILDLPLLREEPELAAPLSIAGRAVALGQLRIDSAHEQPSGPHFERQTPGDSRRGRAPGRRRIASNDVLGRALAAMDRERGR